MTEDLVRWDCDKRGYLLLNSFAGGEEFGRCVQLTVGRSDGYVQMTYDNARAFFKEAIEEINAIEKRYNENPPWWEELQGSSESPTEVE